ncbi:hypothetical protein ACRAWG_25995 [Methylobacterium sp. P31]
MATVVVARRAIPVWTSTIEALSCCIAAEPHLNGRDPYGGAAEIEPVDTAERRVKLVLHADILAQDLSLDFDGLLRQLDLGRLLLLQCVDGAQKADREGR